MLYVIWILLMIYWGLRIIFSTGKFIIGLFIDKSSENNSYSAGGFSLHGGTEVIHSYGNNNYGMSVRCIKD